MEVIAILWIISTPVIVGLLIPILVVLIKIKNILKNKGEK